MAVAVISLLGTLAGSGSSIIMANRLINYRLKKLEELVRERAGAVERIYQLEKDGAVVRAQIEEITHRLEAVERRKERQL